MTEHYPWRQGDLVALCVTGFVGAVAILGAAFAAGRASTLERQVMWLDVALAGLAVFAAGNGVWLMRLRRALGDRRIQLVSLEAAEPEVVAARPARRDTLTLTLVRAVGMTRVHHPDCPLVNGKEVEPANLGDGEPCGVCVP